jgi:CubicO group peptidase (beta-lactamase class C family)
MFRFSVCIFLFEILFSIQAYSSIDSDVTKILSEEKVSAAAVVVTYQNQVLLQKAYGTLDFERKRPTNANSLFHVASASKMFTALAIHKLVQEGKVSLDAPVQRYLPWFKLQNHPEQVKQITIRQLLNHSSGISREMGCTFSDSLGNFLKTPSIRNCSKNQEIVFSPPGSRLKYSNFGYLLLGEIVAEVSKQKCIERPCNKHDLYVQENIFKALRMPNAKFQLSTSESSKLATPYGFTDENSGTRQKLNKVYSTDHHSPAWGMLASAQDFQGILLFLSQIIFDQPNALLRQENAREILRNPIRDPFSTASHALGFMIALDSKTGARRIGHSGNFPGYSTSIFVDESTGLGVAVVSNSVERNATTKISDLAFAFFQKQLGIQKKLSEVVILNVDDIPNQNKIDQNYIDVDSDFLGKYSGWPRTMEFVSEKGQLALVSGGRNQILTPIENNPFIYRQPTDGSYAGHIGEKIEFKRNKQGRVDHLILSSGYIYRKK